MEKLADDIIKVWEELGKQINDTESQLLDLMNRRKRFSQIYVIVIDKKAKTHTEIIRNETNESFYNRLQGKKNEPLKFGALYVNEDYGLYPLTVEKFKSWLSDKDIEMRYFFNLTADDLIKMIDIKEVTEEQE